MSRYSRIQKLVQVVADTETLSDAGALRDRGLDIVIADDGGASAPLVARTAAALALRSLSGPVRVLLPSRLEGGIAQATSIVEAVEGAARSYDADSRVQIGGMRDPSQLELGVGTPVESGAWASAAGWEASVNRLVPGGAAAAPAAVFAACCAFAKTFAGGVLGWTEYLRESWCFDMGQISGLTDLPAEMDVGRLALLGAGAIGNGVAFVLDASGWTADLTIIDGQAYEEPNHETSVLISPSEACQERRKAKVLADLVRRPGLVARGEDELVTSTSRFLAEPFDTFLCAVDNPETRRMLDGVNARSLINAGVGAARSDAGHVVWSRHEPGDPTLSSRHGAGALSVATPRPAPRAPRDLDQCSRIAYDDVSLAAPFMGLAAGALLVAGCAPQAHARAGAVRHLTFDLLKLQAAFQVRRRP